MSKKTSKKQLVLRVFLYCFVGVFVLGTVSLGMVRYSNITPIAEFRRQMVATAMTTMNHQWIARIVASRRTIDAIMSERLIFTPYATVNMDEILRGMGILEEEEKEEARKEDTYEVIEDDSMNSDVYEELYGKLREKMEKQEMVEQVIEEEPTPLQLEDEHYAAVRQVYVDDSFDRLEEGLYFKEIVGNNLRGQLLLVTDPSRVFVATTRTLGTRGDLVRQMVPMNGGIAGINGGWFYDPGFSSEGGVPMGFIIRNGQVVWERSNRAIIVGFTNDNVMIMGEFSVQEALDLGIRDAMMTTPAIIANGAGLVTQGDGGWGIAPRTAIGQRLDGAVLMLTIDGRQPGHSIGGTLRDIQDIMLENDAHNAIMLDGGSSTVMWYDGEYLNRPSLGWERFIPTSFVVRALEE